MAEQVRALTIAEVHEPPSRFRGTIAVVGSHSAAAEPDSAERTIASQISAHL